MEILKKLRDLRKESKLTVEELSKKSGISKSTISVWERGEFVPTVDKLEKALNALGYEIVLKEVEKCDT